MDGRMQAGQLWELAALGANLLGLVVPLQAALDQLHPALAHIGDEDRVLIMWPHDRGHIRLGVEFPAHRKHDPNEAEGGQQRDDEQRSGDEIAAGLDEGGKGITERSSNGPEQEQQQL
jgi:hypothetical protein